MQRACEDQQHSHLQGEARPFHGCVETWQVDTYILSKSGCTAKHVSLQGL